MTRLLFLADRKDGRAIRRRSLKVTTTSTRSAEITKGDANFPHLSIQGNCRAVAAQGSDKVYSRNLARRHISVSNLPQKRLWGGKTAQSLATGLPGFYGENIGGGKSPSAGILVGGRATGRSHS